MATQGIVQNLLCEQTHRTRPGHDTPFSQPNRAQHATPDLSTCRQYRWVRHATFMCQKSTSILCHISLDLRDHALKMAGYQQALTNIGSARSSVRSLRAATRIAPFNEHFHRSLHTHYLYKHRKIKQPPALECPGGCSATAQVVQQ